MAQSKLEPPKAYLFFILVIIFFAQSLIFRVVHASKRFDSYFFEQFSCVNKIILSLRVWIPIYTRIHLIAQ